MTRSICHANLCATSMFQVSRRTVCAAAAYAGARCVHALLHQTQLVFS